MVIAVFGAEGQVGREILRRAPSGLDIRGLSRTEADITDAGRVDEAIAGLRPDVVVNAAAFTAVDAAEGDGRERAWAVNGTGAGHLAATCARHGRPLIHLSTDYVFDGEADAPYDEEARPNPISVYGASKLAGEEAVRDRLSAHVILRTAWVFGFHGANFVKTMLRLGGERPEIAVVDDQRGGPTWAGAIADTVLTVAARIGGAPVTGAGPWGLYHYCGAPTVTRFDFARAIYDEAVRAGLLPEAPRLVPVSSGHFPVPARRPANSALDCRRLAQTFGILQPDWRAGLAAMTDELAAAARANERQGERR